METSKTRLSRSQMELHLLQDAQQEQEATNARLKEKLSRLEVKANTCTMHSVSQIVKLGVSHIL